MKFHHLIIALFMGITLSGHAQKWEGLALTPPMGWSSWNRFGEEINENLIKEIADALVSTKLRDAGYVYVNLYDIATASCTARQAVEADYDVVPLPDKVELMPRKISKHSKSASKVSYVFTRPKDTTISRYKLLTP